MMWRHVLCHWMNIPQSFQVMGPTSKPRIWSLLWQRTCFFRFWYAALPGFTLFSFAKTLLTRRWCSRLSRWLRTFKGFCRSFWDYGSRRRLLFPQSLIILSCSSSEAGPMSLSMSKSCPCGVSHNHPCFKDRLQAFTNTDASLFEY